MCVRYSLSETPEQLADRFNVAFPEGYKKRYNAAPTQLMPVIANLQPGGFSFFFWGAHPQIAKGKNLSKRWIHIDASTIDHKPAVWQAIQFRRCLVPANGFYLWKKVSKKGEVPYWLYKAEAKPFAFAGVWESHKDLYNNKTIYRFSLLTVPANQYVKEFQNEMPLILTPGQEKTWLESKSLEELLPILTGNNDPLINHPVSPAINHLSNDNPQLIEPVKPADQFGNYSLFDFN